MNRRVLQVANRARTRVVAHRPVTSPTAPAGDGVLRWWSWRGPTGPARWLLAEARSLDAVAVRVVATAAVGVVGLILVVAASVLTLAVGLVWSVGQVIGAGLVVGGWAPPAGDLDRELAGLLADPIQVAAVTTAPAKSSSTDTAASDPWSFNDSTDPHLQLQREALELQREALAEMRLQREARTAAMATPPTTSFPVPTYAGRSPRPSRSPRTSRPGARRRFVRGLLVTALVVGVGWWCAAFSLGVAAELGHGPKPPTFQQMEQGR